MKRSLITLFTMGLILSGTSTLATIAEQSYSSTGAGDMADRAEEDRTETKRETIRITNTHTSDEYPYKSMRGNE